MDGTGVRMNGGSKEATSQAFIVREGTNVRMNGEVRNDFHKLL